MSVVTRFAPSPTGMLHIGGARTALFNYLYARHNNGKFLLRIEDTDKKRSTKEAIDAIINGLSWLGINHDEEIVFQSRRVDRHCEVAHELLKLDRAYYCYCTEDDIEKHKLQCETSGETYRHACSINPDKSKLPVIRFRSPNFGKTIFYDGVYGDIIIDNKQLDDLIILRSDGTPTYIFAVVVDDHDMGITQIIRGTDHLTNTSRQAVLYDALNWDRPNFAHIPLIHDENGNKLSKRHGALGVDEYRKMGILPESLRNYLLRLGWSHGDNEIISDLQAIEWFSIENIGHSPSCLNFTKLEHLNNHYIVQSEKFKIFELVKIKLEEQIGRSLSEQQVHYLNLGLDELRLRAKTINHLADAAMFYVADLVFDDEAKAIIDNNQQNLRVILKCFSDLKNWDEGSIKGCIKDIAKNYMMKSSDIYHCIRAAITGTMQSPGIVGIMLNFGKEEFVSRIRRCIAS